ncbi:MAG: hypothetical protein DRH26_16590 [Deltaproteobacteria bacterium]|nr:MAG: hypothetical protein DRH26_16590 [Deltaproteobacteria bacterium]
MIPSPIMATPTAAESKKRTPEEDFSILRGFILICHWIISLTAWPQTQLLLFLLSPITVCWIFFYRV